MRSPTTVPLLVRSRRAARYARLRLGGAMVALLVIIAAGVLFGPAGIRHEPQSAEAALLSEVKKLLASDAQAGDFFGISVAVSGDTAVVGAHLEDAGGSLAGAAYVFQRDQGGPDNWGEVKKLTASDAQAEDRFGISVAVSGDNATVAGGNGNTASFQSATVGGGQSNTASAWYATIGGGNGNTASGGNGTVGGGQANTASGFAATIAGGGGNVGGDGNTASGNYATGGKMSSRAGSRGEPPAVSTASSRDLREPAG